MKVPPEYHGREQSFLKHRFLTEYLRSWAHKLGSRARSGPQRLWYVDVFAGPWSSADAELRDTSIYIGLQALEEAAQTWRDTEGVNIKPGAIFVEKDRRAFARLQDFLRQRQGIVETHPFMGEFGHHVDGIQRLIGSDPAFVFVDPTGFKGAQMQFIAPLMKRRHRDVLVNVMFNHVNRWKDDPRQFLREQMRAFFGLEDSDLPVGLEEPELLRLYRRQLKLTCDIEWAADIGVPHPTIDRTWFRLVVGGKHPKVLEVFRDAERKVMGIEAAVVREEARVRSAAQPSLFSAEETAGAQEQRYTRQRDEDLDRVRTMLRERLGDGELTWQQIWPVLLEDLHLTLRELSRACFSAYKAGELLVSPTPGPKRRTLLEADLISLAVRDP
ncbi:hypothetical protein ENSA5_68340 [Enhygromyxa salina]|uniref:GMT-like wHTH domain-containing protein n=1 Tax=Enhygromyxa salina TaxID=215803 RepID=A0A2S9XB27_9BACT|nr:three-Cys-motif partner protein TcmP [Enhygromyxa salina]PRP90062.1 hypothetical protein ENSA5_68340 [Enhygromyxa salina]